MKFKKAFVCIVLAISMLAMSACDLVGEDEESNNSLYSVNLVLNGGSVDKELTSYEEGEEVTLPVPSRENFDFDGWYDNAAVSGDAVTKITSADTGNKTFYAKWSVKSFTVTLNAAGGTLANELTSYKYMSGATLPSIEKTGHMFGGWFANENLTGSAVTAISEEDSGDKTFWAKWTANKYGVTLNLNGGTLSNNLTEYTYGTETVLPEPTNGTKSFLGWFTRSNFSGSAVAMISATDTGNKTFWAKWGNPVVPTNRTVTLHLQGGTNNEGNLTQYTEGTKVNLPADVTKTNYDFAGWYDNSDCTGSAVTAIPSTQKGDVEYWAKWTPKTYTVTLNAKGGTINKNLTTYVYGTGATLPASANITRSGYTFRGWYKNEDYSGSAVTSISASESGNLTFYAKWERISTSDITISSYGGYNEGIYVEFPKVTGASGYTVSYKYLDDNNTQFVKIDDELVRECDGGIRADVVGIKAGTYEIKVTAGNKEAYVDNIAVTAHDRSGYAHFKATSGVGGYNDDGTPKSDAYIIYVTESTKNTVKAPWNNKKEGIVNVLGNLSSADKSVIVRVIGRISAATWDKSNWATLKALYDSAEKTSGGKIKSDADIVGINNKKLPTNSNDLTQAKLIAGGYNKLQEDITELNGLSSKASYKFSSTESGFDSCWNNCAISGAKNVTVEGIGTDAELFQWGMTWSNSKSIEVRNLTFDDYTEDACSFEGASNSSDISGFTYTRFWVHNCTFNEGKNYWDVCAEQDKREGDGATDFKRVAYITVAYNHYFENHKTGLIGSDNDSTTANVTFHHNYYDTCKSRLPLSRQANMHMYNNYYHDTNGTSISLRANAYAFIEYCYFDGSKNTMIDIQGMGSDKSAGTYGVAKLYNCVMSGKGYNYQSLNSADTTDAKKKLMIVDVGSDRTKTVASSNVFCKNFDTNTSEFYYDSVNKVSKVSNLITDKNSIPTEIPKVAGVLKKAN